jgi:hypothetical protein
VPSVPPLLGTYHPPDVSIGQRVFCQYRQRECVVTAWSSAVISWPRVQPVGKRGGSGLWVDPTLKRAIRTEAAATLKHYFGASATSVWAWRKAFGVGGHAGTRGTVAAHHVASRKGGRAMKARERTAAERKRKAKLSKRLGLRPGPRWTQGNGGWTDDEIALLGTDTDAAVAKKLGRSRHAVRSKRSKLKVPTFTPCRLRGSSHQLQ